VFAAERRQLIVELVRANGAISLHDLASAVQSSEVTVRRDVRALEASGLIDRRYGGAVLPGAAPQERPFSQRTRVAGDAKAAIAELAVTLVENGDALLIGPGTTTREFARRLTRLTNLTVVTNSLLVAQALAHARQIDVVLTGGSLRGPSYALVGSGAEQSLTGMRVRLAFLSGSGLTVERGLSTPNMLSASVDRAIANAAQDVVVLADHTKVGRDSMFQTVPADRIGHLVTDSQTDAEVLASLEALGVTAHIAALLPPGTA
jgi:DeoR/GlpR family transcriptional regulator of sugar metabolism